jgi:hypothetical protein
VKNRIKHIIMMGLVCMSTLSAQQKWQKSSADELMKAMNLSKAYIHKTNQFNMLIVKTIATANAQREVLAVSQMAFRRNGALLWIKGKDVDIRQNAQILVTIDSANKTIVVDKSIDLATKSMLGNSLDALVQNDYKDILKLVSTTQTQYQFKYQDDNDSTMQYVVQVAFNNQSGQMLKSVQVYDKVQPYQISKNKQINAKMQVETVFKDEVNKPVLTEKDFSLEKILSIDQKGKVMLNGKYKPYQLVDQRMYRE